jgi:hypothetical protein
MDNFKVDLREVMVGAEKTSAEATFSSTATFVSATPIASSSREAPSVSATSSHAGNTTPTISTTASPETGATSGGISNIDRGMLFLVISLLLFALATVLLE